LQFWSGNCEIFVDGNLVINGYTSLNVRNITRMINARQYNFLEQLIDTEPVNFIAFVELKSMWLYSIEPSPTSSTESVESSLYLHLLLWVILTLSPCLCLDKPSNIFSLAFSIKILLVFRVSYI